MLQEKESHWLYASNTNSFVYWTVVVAYKLDTLYHNIQFYNATVQYTRYFTNQLRGWCVFIQLRIHSASWWLLRPWTAIALRFKCLLSTCWRRLNHKAELLFMRCKSYKYVHVQSDRSKLAKIDWLNFPTNRFAEKCPFYCLSKQEPHSKVLHKSTVIIGGDCQASTHVSSLACVTQWISQRAIWRAEPCPFPTRIHWR